MLTSCILPEDNFLELLLIPPNSLGSLPVFLDVRPDPEQPLLGTQEELCVVVPPKAGRPLSCTDSYEDKLANPIHCSV